MYQKFKASDDQQPDISIYRRDFQWGMVTGLFTGMVFSGVTGGSSGGSFTGTAFTGMEYIPFEPSSFEVQDGVVDNCHSTTYNHGESTYFRTEYVPLGGESGVIQAWLQADIVPVPDFTYVIDSGNPLKVKFTDVSMYSPVSWQWNFGGGAIAATSTPTYVFPGPGVYYVTLVVSNASGPATLSKKVTIV